MRPILTTENERGNLINGWSYYEWVTDCFLRRLPGSLVQYPHLIPGTVALPRISPRLTRLLYSRRIRESRGNATVSVLLVRWGQEDQYYCKLKPSDPVVM